MTYEIIIPEPITIKQLDGSVVVDADGKEIPPRPFWSFVDERTCDPLFAGPKGTEQAFTVPVLLAAMRCSEAVRGTAVATLSADDYGRLRRATEEGAYHPAAGRAQMPFILAILNAKTDQR